MIRRVGENSFPLKCVDTALPRPHPQVFTCLIRIDEEKGEECILFGVTENVAFQEASSLSLEERWDPVKVLDLFSMELFLVSKQGICLESVLVQEYELDIHALGVLIWGKIRSKETALEKRIIEAWGDDGEGMDY